MTTKDCLCGCGERTKGGNFLPGHDQKLRAAIESAMEGLENVRKLVEDHLERPVNVLTSKEKRRR